MAATDILRQLAVSLTLNTGNFSRNATAAEKRAASMEKKFGSVGSKITGRISNSMKSFAAGLAGAFSIGAIVSLTKSGLEFASSLGEVAQQLGVTSTEMQEYRYAATQVGISQDQMDDGLSKLTKTLGLAAAGGKAQSAAFSELGISIRDANGHVKSAGVIIPEIADALSKIPDPASRAAAEIALFGRNGQKLDTLLSGGSSAINGLRTAAHDLGIVLSEEQIRKADETADKLAAIKTVLSARIAGVVADNAGSILKLADSFKTLVGWLGTAIRSYQAFYARAQQVGGWIDAHNPHMDAAGRRSGTITQAAAEARLRDLQNQQRGGTSADDRAAAFRKRLGANRSNFTGQGMNAFRAAADSIIKMEPAAVEAVDELKRSFADLFTELNPVEAKEFDFTQKLQTLNNAVTAGFLPAELLEGQINKLKDAFGKGIPSLTVEDIGGTFEDAMVRLDEQSKEHSQAVADNFAQMSQAVVGSLGSLAQSIKSGGFLNILESAAQLAVTVIGGLQSAGIIKTPAPAPRAAGGPVVPGRAYLVGEQGPEYVRFGSRGYVTPNRKTGGGGTSVHVIPSAYFDVVVDGRVQRQVAPAAGHAAIAGARGGVAAMHRQASRQFPR